VYFEMSWRVFDEASKIDSVQVILEWVFAMRPNSTEKEFGRTFDVGSLPRISNLASGKFLRATEGTKDFREVAC